MRNSISSTLAPFSAADIAHSLPKGRKSGAGFIACCPAHEDTNPSLTLRDEQGKVLAHCHAGCDQRAVIEALKSLGLWPDAPERHQQRAITATYDYTDESGMLLYQVVRTEPKGFFQRRPAGTGGWISKKSDHQVLYHLPEVLQSSIVFVVEGEKDVENLREHGFAAATNAGGAKAPWLSDYTEALRGREIILIPDNDPPGWRRVSIIAKALFGSAARIRVFDLPTNTKDISDWFAAGHSECELIAMLKGVHAV